MTLFHFHFLCACISPVAIHDEGHMLWNWARFEHVEEEMPDMIDKFIPERVYVL
jgi:hypothetical protein